MALNADPVGEFRRSLEKETPRKRIVVIGAGVTGLTAAHALEGAGHQVLVLERADRPGGVIRSVRRDGWLVETGPNTLLVNEPRMLEFFERLGLGPRLLEAPADARRRYLVRGGRPIAAPTGPLSFLASPLLGPGAKLRLLCEPLVRRARPGAEESVAAFTRRRLGAEALAQLVDPFVGGIHAGDPETLSIRHAFPTLHRHDREHGSLVLGALAAAQARRRAGRARFGARSISFRGGLQALIDALVHEVGDRLETRATITALEPGAPWRIRWRGADDREQVVEADAVVAAVPAHAAARLPFPLAQAAALAGLDGLDHPPVTALALGFRREQIAHPLDGYGMLVPAREGMRILGTLFSSSLFPDRAPPGGALLSTFVGGSRRPDLARLPEPELVRVVLEDLATLLGVRGDPVFVHRTAWERAIPQYGLDHDRFLAVVAAAEAGMPGLHIGGPIRDGISVGDCLRAGWRLAGCAAQPGFRG